MGHQGAHPFVENVNAHGNLVPFSPDDLINRLPRKLITHGQILDWLATLIGSKNLAIAYFIPWNSHAGAPRLRRAQHISIRHFFNMLTMPAIRRARGRYRWLRILSPPMDNRGQGGGDPWKLAGNIRRTRAWHQHLSPFRRYLTRKRAQSYAPDFSTHSRGGCTSGLGGRSSSGPFFQFGVAGYPA